MLALGVGNAWGAGAWTLVKDASTLSAGDKVVIVAKDVAVALSTTQNGNNRGEATVTKSDETLTLTDGVQELTLEVGTKSGTLAFNTGSGYLYAASSSKNYLRTETKLSDNSSWKIEIATTGVATVKAQGSNTRNLLQYNKSSEIFSAYSGAQQSIQLYKYIEEQSGGETPDPTPVTVTLNKTELNLQAGATETLTATVTGSTESVTWSSSKTAVASVDNKGKVTAVAAGEATITAAIGDVKATCAVTVTDATTPEEPGTGGESGSYTWDLSKKTYTTGTNEVTWTCSIATMHNKGTNATNYLGGDANSRTSSRFYTGNTLTITPAANISISSVEFVATSENYANVLKNSTWTNASASISSSTVTITPSKGASAISATISGTCGFKGVTVYYTQTGGGSGETVASVKLTPDVKDFGTVNVGETPSQEFTITTENTTAALTASIDDDTNYAISDIVDNKMTVTYQPQSAGTHPATLTVKAGEEATATVKLTGTGVKVVEGTWTLVTDVTELLIGSKVVIVAAEYDYALSTEQKTNNRGQAAVTKSENTITFSEDVQIITLESGTKANTFAFNTGSAGYLYAASSTSNYLKTDDELTDNSSWTITIEDGATSVVAQGTNTRNILQYNQSSSIFAAYGSAQKAIVIYKNADFIPAATYSITYVTNGGSEISPTKVNNIPATLPTPSKEGYNFAGWYTDEALTIPVVTGTALTSDITLYAKWADPYSVAYARTLIAADSENAGVYAYVVGVVTAVEEINTEYGNATYSIGDTEDATEILKVYRGNYLADEKFTAADQLKVGDQVVVYGKMINHATGGYQFTQGNYIYKLTSATGKETTSLSWSATTCKVQIGATNTFPTLTKSHDITIKYTSSNTSVATIANDGSITLVAAGTTTITAAIEEDATYAASSASYKLTVVEVVPTGIFQLYSGEMTEGEYVLVDGAKDKALKAAVAGSTRLAGEDVTIENDAILNPDASIVWNIAKSGTDWTIYNEYEGKYVAGTVVKNAAQLLTDGTDENTLWTISGTETYDIVNKVNDANSVNSHLRWGGDYYACYGSSTGKTLRLYKKIDVPTPTISHPSGTYLGSQNVAISCALATATIYYTINGSAPTTSSASIAAGGTVSITESCTLKAIAVANGKESALVEATYEIVATGGVWVLVDDASALEAGDLLVFASNNHNVVAGTIADDKDFMTSVDAAAFNANKTIMTTLPANAMILTLGGSEGAWTFEYQELYLNASGTKNLYGDNPTAWTITIDETGAAISTGENTIKYNATSPRFKVYGSTFNGNLPQIYKYTADFYTRDLTNNQYGTICLENGGVVVAGAKIFEIAYKNTQTNRVLVDEVVRLKAGVPYVFLPNAAQIKIALDGTTAGTASKVNGLQGTFIEITDGAAGTAGNILEGKHVLYNNAIRKCGGNCQLPAYRAYFLVDEITTTEPAQVPGRRRVALDYQGENQATGLDNIGAPENDAVKVLMNGQMIIIRNGEKFNAQGVKL